MRSGAIEVELDVLLQHATQMSLVEYDHVIEALPAYRTQEAFADGVQIGSARRDPHHLDPSARSHGGELLAELRTNGFTVMVVLVGVLSLTNELNENAPVEASQALWHSLVEDVS